MKLKEYKLGLITGKGRTITAARAHAACQAIEAIAQLDEGPLLLSGPPGGCVAIMISPVLGGSWAYGKLESWQPRLYGWQVSGCKTKPGAMWFATLHAAQNVIDNVDTKTAFAKLDALVDWSRTVFNDERRVIAFRSELHSRLAWRARYDAWRATGATDDEAHCKATAGGFPPAKETP